MNSAQLSARALAPALASTLLFGCFALAPKALEPDGEHAVVKAANWGGVYRGGYVGVISIGGALPSWKSSREVVVPAGRTSGQFYAYLCPQPDQKDCNSIAGEQFPVKLEAGHLYLARAQEKFNGSNTFWVWVEDQTTHALAGGQAPAR